MASLSLRCAASTGAVGTSATSSRRSQFARGVRLGAVATKRRSPVVLRRIVSEIKWTLDVDEEWLGSKEGEGWQQVYPIDVTGAIDKNREGPNNTGKITIGAVPDMVDVALVVSTVSGVHALLEEDGDTGDLFITDLGSTNGTFVGGVKIQERTRLNPGDRVSLGDVPKYVVLRNAVAHA